MAANSKIEWCDHTFNPWLGCTKVSPACDHCYAEGWAKRTGNARLWQGERRRTTEAYWNQPLKWNRQAEREGRRFRVFCASLADVFDNQVITAWRADLWREIFFTPHLDWLLLTKRPQNIAKMLPTEAMGTPAWGAGWPNVWLGTTVENQTEADRRIPHLLSVPAAVHFLSCEPLLGPLDLRHHKPRAGVDRYDWLTGERWNYGHQVATLARIDWIIAGGESGPRARASHPDWFRRLRDQCAAAGAPFFFKQWGAWAHADQPQANGRLVTDDWTGSGSDGQGGLHWWEDGRWSVRLRRAAAGRLLDGIEHNAFPSPAPGRERVASAASRVRA